MTSPAKNMPPENSEAAILDRLFRPSAGGWSRAAAQAILGINFDQYDHQEMTRLLEHAKAGELSDVDAQLLESYRHLGRLLELMKSRARRSLQTAATR